MNQIKQPRFLALDVFRGFAIAAMILVNTPGSWAHVYSPLTHADWHGLTFADLIFPFFLFAVGASLYFSLYVKNARLTKALFIRVAKRALIMFAIGWGLNIYNYVLLDLEHIRTMGVLQRIAICYFCGALLIAAGGEKAVWTGSVLILVLYTMVFFLLGGAQPFAFEGSIVAAFDRAILGEAAMWKMHGVAFDPEGLLSTAPAVVSLLMGFEVTRQLMVLPRDYRAMARLLIWGTALMAGGLLVAGIIPVNKNLWTSSYTLLTGGISVMVLALCVWAADILESRPVSRPFEIFGTNPLFIYCLSWLFATAMMAIPITQGENTVSLYTWLWHCLLPLFTPKIASLLFALLHVVFFWLVSLLLYRRGIVVKI